MEKLSLDRQLAIVRLYLGGLPYDGIAAQAGVSKGSVANVVADLKAGQVLDVQEPAEQLELLRGLASEVRRAGLTTGQAVTGVYILSQLQELGVEPNEVERLVAVCRRLAEGTETQTFVRAALYLHQLEKSSGLGPAVLEDKVHTLLEEAARLEPLVGELRRCKRELKKLQKGRRGLADEIRQLEERSRPIRESLIAKEQREAELSRRVSDLEQRAQSADDRLTAARKQLQALASLGLTVEDLTGLTQRLAMVAHRHGIEPRSLRDRLLYELEGLDAGLGLESLVKLRRRELKENGEAIAKAQHERAALDSALQELRQQQARLQATMAAEEATIRKRMQGVTQIAVDTMTKLRQDLGDVTGQTLAEIRKLTSQALKLGQEFGRYDAMVEANQWLQTLLALTKGDGSAPAMEVRTVGLVVLRGVKGWLHQNESQASLPAALMLGLNSAIEELERWMP